MSATIPQGALSVLIPLILYSTVCLSPNVLLGIYLIRSPDRFNYVSVCAWLLVISTTSSIIQQIHYAVNWEVIKIATFEQSKLTDEFPGLRLVGTAEMVQLVCFRLQNTIYNVVAVMMCFWSAHLFIGMWKITWHVSTRFKDVFRRACFAFAVIVPSVFQGILHIDAIKRSLLASLIIYNCLFVTSTSLGSLLVILTLSKYIKSRRDLSRIGGRQSSYTTSFPRNLSTDNPNRSLRKKDEKWLIVRFTIGFSILMLVEMCMVVYQIVQARNYSHDRSATAPDFSVERTKNDLLAFFPGVTASLIYWLVFGTTAVLRKEHADTYRSVRDWVLDVFRNATRLGRAPGRRGARGRNMSIGAGVSVGIGGSGGLRGKKGSMCDRASMSSEQELTALPPKMVGSPPMGGGGGDGRPRRKEEGSTTITYIEVERYWPPGGPNGPLR
ncbi:hypothetical protein AJ79_05197 [Helicocarpus griseus UAMH5409]|uniref:G-protein coupled receptors family 1 profile domain-containing protein n=1 Tax=Helicocarpus griseus UAMH5409 TaxID=1447875 RepID=A0A2B7XQA5_9EURO|nr:hypothetical protein AJ79_05197 [Helicocarpus griseus UAMH5409]